jgi:WD40 repeat protein
MNRFLSYLRGDVLLLGMSLAVVGCSSSSSRPQPDGSAPQRSGDPQWSLDKLKEDKTFVGHTATVTGVAISTLGHRAVSCSQDKTLRIWDVQDGRERHKIEVPEGVGRMALSPDGKRVLYGGWTRKTEGSTTPDVYQLRLCDTETGKEIARLPDVRDMVDSVAFSPDGRRALSGGNTHAYLWDANTRKLLHTFDGLQNHTYAVAFSPDGTRGLAVSGNNVVVLDLEKKATLGTFSVPKDMPMALAVSADGHKALSGGFDKTLRLWDVGTQKEEHAFLGHTGAIKYVTFLPDKRHAVSGAMDGTIRFWDLEAKKEVESLKDQLGQETALTLSANGQWLLFGTKDFAVRLQKSPHLP